MFEKLLCTISPQSSNLVASNLDRVIDYLNKIAEQQGFIYQNYTPGGTQNLPTPRRFFSDENGMIIDAIRIQIESWKMQNLLSETEYFVLIACLIETVSFYANITGIYAAFHKKWDPRALKKLLLRSIKIITNDKQNQVFNQDSVELLDVVKADIFYLDPPYNQRQYAPNYHLLETIAKYDNPKISGVAGLREYQSQKSKFCNAKTGLGELDLIAKKGKFKYLILSYNSEGIMASESILQSLKQYGKTELIEFDYLRFKSNNNGQAMHKKYVKEQVYILEK